MNFLKLRYITYLISGALLIVSYTSFFTNGFNYGIDFTGGVLIQVKFNKSVNVEDIRKSLANEKLGTLTIQRIGSIKDNLFIIKSKIKKHANETIDLIKTDLIKYFGSENVEQPFQRSEMVGPAIGKDLRNLAYLLILISLIAILFYISLRFQFKFAVASIVALVHDVSITLGTFSMLHKEINIPIVAAVLTIIGYSLNDTIVVFDRIRENLKFVKQDGIENIINRSINSTLSRTVITSLTTLLTVLTLYFLGGTVIHDFAFAFLIGVIVGTYSSIFVASPVVYEWWIASEKKHLRKKSKK